MTLPQQHGWQVIFRDWIAGKNLFDFECGLPGPEYSEAFFGSDDDVYRLWITLENLGRHTAKLTGARIDSCCYLLENIEQDGTGDMPAGIYMKLDETIEPGALAWLYSWEYGGNPWYQKTELANRAIVACMVDMIMCHNKYIDGGLASISQAVSSAFATWGYVFGTCYSLLGDDEIGAWSECMQAFFHTIEEQGTTGTQADMDLPAIVGMYYSTELLFGYEERAEAYARAFLEKHFKEAGYIDHGGGFDPSYNGISIKYMAWAAHVTGYQFLIDALGKMSKLKAHLTFPEPPGEDGAPGMVLGPSSFATSTALSSAQDQHYTFGRDAAVNFLTDEAAYLLYGSRNVESWLQPFGLKSPDEMRVQIESWIQRANGTEPAFNTWVTVSDLKPSLWEPSWHLQIPQIEWDFYPGEDHYGRVAELHDAQSAFPPVARPSFDFIEQFGNDFVTWKLGKMAGVIHTGGLSWYPDRDNGGLCGLSGGSLCALWTENTGMVLLGLSGASQGPDPDTWDNIDIWATNHVKATKDGVPYSNARDKKPGLSPGISDDHAVINLTSQMQPEGLGIEVARTIEIKEEGVEVAIKCVQTGVMPDTLHEVLPLYLGEKDAWMLTEVRFLIGGKWVDEPGLCKAVKIERNAYLVKIEFEEPQQVSLGDIWTNTYQNVQSRIQPLNIDIAATGEVRYTITGPYVHELRKA